MKNKIFEGFQFLENKSFSNNIDLEKKHDNNKYINIKEETNNENEKEIKQNNLIINLKNKEKLSHSHPDFHHVKFDDLINKYTIVDMPKKDFIIYKCYQYITNLNDNDKNKISKKNEIILNENIKLIIKKLSPVFILQINGEEIVINKEARKICFIDQVKQIKYIRFIFSADCLYNVLDELKFNYYYVKPQENNNINYEEKSINSECSVNNHFFIFSKEYITEIMKDNLKPIFSENNLLSLKKDEITFLKDLSNNFQYYNDEKKENKFIELDEYNQLFNQIKESIYSNNTKIIYIFGPKGVSKTIFLLYFRNFILFENIHSLYFDYNYLKNQRDYFQIKKILQYELLYSFLNFEEMCLFEKQKIFYHLEQEKNILSYIHKFLKKFLELKVPQKGKKFIIIIDNIHLPKEYRGQNYDLLILSKIEGIHYSDFVQIGVNKTASEIKSILQNIKDKEEVIINNIKNNFQIENVRVSLLFIFDLKTQIKVNYKAVCDCLKNNINYYLFSSEEQCFYRHNFINKMNEKIFTYTPYLSNDLNLNSFLNKKRSTRTRKTKKRNY